MFFAWFVNSTLFEATSLWTCRRIWILSPRNILKFIPVLIVLVRLTILCKRFWFWGLQVALMQSLSAIVNGIRVSRCSSSLSSKWTYSAQFALVQDAAKIPTLTLGVEVNNVPHTIPVLNNNWIDLARWQLHCRYSDCRQHACHSQWYFDMNRIQSKYFSDSSFLFVAIRLGKRLRVW